MTTCTHTHTSDVNRATRYKARHSKAKVKDFGGNAKNFEFKAKAEAYIWLQQ